MIKFDLYKRFLDEYQDIRNSHLNEEKKRNKNNCCQKYAVLGHSKIDNTTTDVEIGYSYDGEIRGLIPENVMNLSLGKNYNKKLNPGDIPPTVKILDLGEKYNHILEEGVIPYGVEKLVLSDMYDKIIKPGVIPESVIELTIKHNLKYPLEEGSIPKSVIKLNFVSMYNQYIKPNVIPNGVKIILFSLIFNQNLDGVIPNSVIILSFGYLFRTSFDISSLTNLIELSVCESYDLDEIKKNPEKNILINIKNGHKTIYWNNKLEIDIWSHVYFYKIIIDIYTLKYKLIGNVILRELVEKVFNPLRLQRIAKLYNVNFHELVENLKICC